MTRAINRAMTQAVLSVKNLSLSLRKSHTTLVHEINFALDSGRCLALVGESGCGKSLTAMSLAGLLPPAITLQTGNLNFLGNDLHNFNEQQWQNLRGNQIGVIFQNPLTAFNPTARIGDQIAEVLVRHKQMSWSDAQQQAIALLERMGVTSPAQRARQYPFEFSGGMLQRAMIAMAVACKPRLLIADEPTTALDVTVQAQVLNLLRELQQEHDMALLLITHDLAVVSEMADQVAVMYAGRFVETGSAAQVLQSPSHPYTQALKAAVPELIDYSSTLVKKAAADYKPLMALPGTPPDPASAIKGCAFAPRCAQAMNLCARENPPWFGDALDNNQHQNQQQQRCWLSHEAIKSQVRPS